MSAPPGTLGALPDKPAAPFGPRPGVAERLCLVSPARPSRSASGANSAAKLVELRRVIERKGCRGLLRGADRIRKGLLRHPRSRAEVDCWKARVRSPSRFPRGRQPEVAVLEPFRRQRGLRPLANPVVICLNLFQSVAAACPDQTLPEKLSQFGKGAFSRRAASLAIAKSIGCPATAITCRSRGDRSDRFASRLRTKSSTEMAPLFETTSSVAASRLAASGT